MDDFCSSTPCLLRMLHRYCMNDFRCVQLPCWGYAVAQLVDTLLKAGRSRVRFPMVSLEFFIDNPPCIRFVVLFYFRWYVHFNGYC
jgi:hypothetical protein